MPFFPKDISDKGKFIFLIDRAFILNPKEYVLNKKFGLFQVKLYLFQVVPKVLQEQDLLDRHLQAEDGVAEDKALQVLQQAHLQAHPDEHRLEDRLVHLDLP